MPNVQVPAATAAKGPRLFELRTYESHNERAHRMKVKMFAEMGEIEIFRKAGLTPVFFARTPVGPRMPSLSTCSCTTTWPRARRAGTLPHRSRVAQAVADAGIHRSGDRLEHHDRFPAAGGLS